MIHRRVVKDGHKVFGHYLSPTTELIIHYENFRDRDSAEKSTAHIDVEMLFDWLETLDRFYTGRR